jgi:hypothetical protein
VGGILRKGYLLHSLVRPAFRANQLPLTRGAVRSTEGLQHIPPPQRQKKTSEPETEKAARSAELLTRTAFIGCGWLEVEPISSPEKIKKYATM